MAVALVNGRVLGDDGLVDGLCVLLDAGRVVDTGTLDALIARQPLLREMWRGYTTEPPSERAA